MNAGLLFVINVCSLSFTASLGRPQHRQNSRLFRRCLLWSAPKNPQPSSTLFPKRHEKLTHFASGMMIPLFASLFDSLTENLTCLFDVRNRTSSLAAMKKDGI